MTSSSDSNQHAAAGTGPRDPVAKAFAILGALVDSGQRSWTARALASQLGAPVSTVHRTLTSLVNAGILRQDPATSAYVFASELHRIARRVVADFPLPDLAREHLRFLADETGETALLTIYDGGEHKIMFASQVEGRHPLRYVVPINSWIPIHKGASGLTILAYLTPEQRAAALDVSVDESETVDVDALDEMLTGIRARGYAVSHGQRIAGATGIAAPVFGARGQIAGDLMVTMPHGRFTTDDEPRLAALVQDRAQALSRSIGGPAPTEGTH